MVSANKRSGIAARAAAQEILGSVLRRRIPLDAAIESVLGSQDLESRDAGFAVAIATETLRRFGQLQAIIHRFVKKLPPQHRAGPTFEILLAGACELLFLKVPPHATVDAANELAAANSKAVHFRSLINAVLRRVAREGDAIIATQDAGRLTTPDWLWDRWCETYGEDAARSIAASHLVPPLLDIQAKPNASIVPAGMALPGRVLRLANAGRIEELPGYREGEWWVQDFAATLPAWLLGEVRGQTVIDLCAAPGGKTAQLAANGANVIAVERDRARLQRLAENLSRVGLTAHVVESDVRDFSPTGRVPFVLLDAPCSATGTIRRHPDLPWIKSAADIGLCAHGAGELLDAAAEMVCDGGVLVFAVCSLEPEEGPGQAETFLAEHPEFRKDPVRPEEVFGLADLLSDGALRTLPCHLAERGGMDGFYAARFRRSG